MQACRVSWHAEDVKPSDIRELVVNRPIILFETAIRLPGLAEPKALTTLHLLASLQE